MIGFKQDGTRLAYNVLMRDGRLIDRLAIDGRVVYNRLMLENKAVEMFLNETYPDDFDDRSKMRKYYALTNEGSRASWTEWPKPVPMLTRGVRRVRMMEKDTGIGMSFDADGSLTLIYNLKPGVTYTYTMTDEDGMVVETGEMTPEGRVRMLAMPTLLNVRDIGGWPTMDGGRLRFGRILRGPHLDDLVAGSADARMLVEDLQVTADLDLRLANERYTHEDIGLRYYGTEYSGRTVKSDRYGVNAYASMLNNPRNVANCIQAIVDELEAGGCVYCHCTHGVDRTGTLLAVIMAAVGCAFDPCLKEWELSSLMCWCNSKLYDKERLKKEFPQGEFRTFSLNVRSYSGDTYPAQTRWWLVNKAGVSETLIDRLRDSLVSYG